MARACKDCQKMCPDADFLSSQKYPDLCYKCVYAKKMSLFPKIAKCKVCECKLPKGRWTYCSEECLEIGSKKLKTEYWAFNMQPPVVGWA